MTGLLNREYSTFMPLSSALKPLLRRLELCRFRSAQLVRVQASIAPLDMLTWLANIAVDNRAYFSHRDQSTVIAGLGIAAELQAAKPSAISAVLTQAQQWVKGTEASWIGGCAFNGRSGTHQWQGFPGARFVLPLIEIKQQQGHFTLAFNLRAESFGQWQQQVLAVHTMVRDIAHKGPKTDDPVIIEQRKNSVGLNIWREQINEALGRIRANEIQKVVIAREVKLELAGTPNPFLALKSLQLNNPNCYTFAIESEGKLFFGCSPERLFRREGQQLITEALAGTVKRGDNHTNDKTLENTLLHDPKLIHEHQLVAQAIEESLQGQTLHPFKRAPVTVVKLGRVQHRYQKMSATVHPVTSNSHLYKNLHPTPAICGYPRVAAQSLINEIEQLGRGWYSGNVGVINAHCCELSVAIRSALSDKNRLWLYSGVGIVEGSNADEEWAELESKLESMLQALGYPPKTIQPTIGQVAALNCNA